MKKAAKNRGGAARARRVVQSSSSSSSGSIPDGRTTSARRGGKGKARAIWGESFDHYDAALNRAYGECLFEVDGHATHIRERSVKCGKKCQQCPHGVYFYEVWRGDDGRVHERYLGKFRKGAA